MATATSTHDDIRATVVTLLSRAERLHGGADSAHPVVATAYRRRAAELTFAAWIGALRTAPVPVDTVIAAAHGLPFGEAA
jgi:hypothetical protein